MERGFVRCAVLVVIAALCGAQTAPSDWQPRIDGAHMLFSAAGDAGISSDLVRCCGFKSSPSFLGVHPAWFTDL